MNIFKSSSICLNIIMGISFGKMGFSILRGPFYWYNHGSFFGGCYIFKITQKWLDQFPFWTGDLYTELNLKADLTSMIYYNIFKIVVCNHGHSIKIRNIWKNFEMPEPNLSLKHSNFSCFLISIHVMANFFKVDMSDWRQCRLKIPS